MATTSVTMLHPYNAYEEVALNAFRKKYVDLTDQAATLGRAIRDSLIRQLESLSGRDGFPVVLIGQSFGAGSFGRKTLCQPLGDIDMYLVLNACGMRMYDGAAIYRLEGEAVGPLTSDYSLRVIGWISSDLVLRRIVLGLCRLPFVVEQKAIVGMNTKGKSAFIRFPRWGVKVDVTPVVWATDFVNSIDRYYMPQGRGSIWWKPTNPKEDQRRLSELNQAHGGLVLPTIRMLKWWNKNRNQDRLKGIHLEVMAEQAMASHYLYGIGQALHICFESFRRQLPYSCLDPTGLGEPLDKNLSWQKRQASLQAVEEAYRHAENAGLWSLLGDSERAIAAWRGVFPV